MNPLDVIGSDGNNHVSKQLPLKTASSCFNSSFSSLTKQFTPELLKSDNESVESLANYPLLTDNPSLVHQWNHEYSVVCVSVSSSRGLLFCGTQDAKILVFDLNTYEKIHVLQAHEGAVLCLEISANEKFLFSGGSDSLLRIWDLETMTERFTIYSLMDIGDIFSITWIQDLNMVFFGTQNACILYAYVEVDGSWKNDPSFLPANRYDNFFDSKGPGGNMNPKQSKKNKQHTSPLVEVDTYNILRYAHNGYVYAMQSFKRTPETVEIFINIPSIYNHILVSGGGDGLVKLWGVGSDRSVVALHELDNEDSVLSMVISGSFLYAGLVDGQVNLWDLGTFQLIRSTKTDEGDVLSLALYADCLFKGTEHGITKWKLQGARRTDWVTHEGYALTVKLFERQGNPYLITGGVNNRLALWSLDGVYSASKRRSLSLSKKSILPLDNDSLLQTLAKFVSYKTVSKLPQFFIDDSRRCASFLVNLLTSFGATAQLIPVKNGNPIIHACFPAQVINSAKKKPSRILWYGHYDVVSADQSNGWVQDPFKMSAMDGYLYGRGVTDNKGPLLAAIYSVAELFSQDALKSDVVFLIEGEEESASFGFQEAVGAYKDVVGEIDWIFLSNSYWIDDHLPCINYGLRGVVGVKVEISSDKPDRHSGVDGGVSREPAVDLVKLISKLTSNEGRILLPGFFDGLNPPSEEEEKDYERILERAKIKSSKEMLMAKWRYPSLTVHKVTVSGPGNNTIIPQMASAAISLRITPEQNLESVKNMLVSFLKDKFKDLKTENECKISITHEAEPWLGDRRNTGFQVLENAIINEWGIEPLYIREGGSIPSIRFLEKVFGAPAIHYPCGQASDNAHLDNERLRVRNLYKSRNILNRVFQTL
ncbi:hypothetical protein LJB42_002274 [Komagataella kurtzmanii]|nr:hypothetical protein LJB42_002274 [Komagataella kurtzmanii]